FLKGFYIEAINHPDVKQWWRSHGNPVHAVERLVRLAMREWKTNKRYSANSRAYQTKVKRGQWKQYSRIYDTISAIPVEWECEVLQKAKKELRNIA
ncbi:MAG: hypothetical protein HKM99_12275, partial [Flavobacteriaceae bacterium]|nr:hypothetical protein [Flavobacteriaceae bacterium]